MKRYLSLVFLLLTLMLAACGGKEVIQADPQQSLYEIYYADQSLTALHAELAKVQEESEDAAVLAGDLIDLMQQNPEKVDLVSAIPTGIRVIKIEQNGKDQLFVYFNASYSSLEPVQEILCRAAIVKTLAQIPGIEFIGFYINNQPMMDAEQKTINMMTADSFTDGSQTSYSTTLTLYYADESGTKLVKTEKKVVAVSGVSMEQLVMQQLIAGPSGSEVYGTIPKETKLVSISVQKGICYVNVSSEFLNNTKNAAAEIPIYSLVNSLTELSNINKVQILVDGESKLKFRDSISLEKPFERDISFVENPETPIDLEE